MMEMISSKYIHQLLKENKDDDENDDVECHISPDVDLDIFESPYNNYSE